MTQNTRYTIKFVKAFAKNKGGVCLSDEYIQIHSHLAWRCNLGHEWKATFANIKRGKWCPRCGQIRSAQAKITHTIEEMQSLAAKQGGKCLSQSYINTTTKLNWECAKGHRFQSPPAKILQGNWCPRCIGRYKTIKELNDYAAKFKGKCLTSKYLGSGAKHHWQCQMGHRWFATPTNVLRGVSWCPECSSGYGEQLVRSFFEQLYGKSFVKVRPDWLRSERGIKLELDGYCGELALAFEHQGKFHYKADHHFHRKGRGLKVIQELDKIKAKTLKTKGISLFVIPEIGQELPLNRLKEYVAGEFKRLGIRPPKGFRAFVPNFRSVQSKRGTERYIEIRSKATEWGGKLLSQNYHGMNMHYDFECKSGHRFKMTASSVVHGQWCPTCRGTPKKTVPEIREIAKKRGGKLISKVYEGSNSNLTWECKKGHQWEATTSNVLRGTWCPTCSRRKKLTIEIMQEMAKEFGGECLSKKYIRNSSKIKWKCKNGHVWSSLPLSVRKGHWCGKCAVSKRSEISDVSQKGRLGEEMTQ